MVGDRWIAVVCVPAVTALTAPPWCAAQVTEVTTTGWMDDVGTHGRWPDRRSEPPVFVGTSLAALSAEAEGERDRAANALLSLAIPGVGQLRSGRARGWVYLAAEASLWGWWFERRSRGSELRDRYRDLAWTGARVQSGPRMDPSFAYYETLSKWARSGAFDASPSPGIQPELDPATFNGSIWSLAQSLFLAGDPGATAEDPGWDAAIDYYRGRAYDDRFLWDWSRTPGAQNEFSTTISESDRRFRQATDIVGVVIVNHILSGVDAYLSAHPGQPLRSVRLRPDPSVAGRLGVSAHFKVPN